MDRCHICEEKAEKYTALRVPALTHGAAPYREYPLCPEHALKMGDYMVTLLQQHLNEKKGA